MAGFPRKNRDSETVYTILNLDLFLFGLRYNEVTSPVRKNENFFFIYPT